MVVVKDHQQREPSMGDITTIGLDLAKNVFQLHAVDEAGSVVMRKRLRRGQVLAFFARIPPCLVGMEACATAHHWARELIALGHEARLMPPTYVKAYVKRNKHDVADAEAICEAVRRPSMRFVPVKTAEQQSALMMHRARDLLIRQRTMASRLNDSASGTKREQYSGHLEMAAAMHAHPTAFQRQNRTSWKPQPIRPSRLAAATRRW